MAANYWVSSGKVRVLDINIDLVDDFIEVSFFNGRTYKIIELSINNFGSRCVKDNYEYQLLYKEFTMAELIAIHAWNVFGNLKKPGQYIDQIDLWGSLLKTSDLEKIQKCVDRFNKYKFLPHGPHIRLYDLS